MVNAAGDGNGMEQGFYWPSWCLNNTYHAKCASVDTRQPAPEGFGYVGGFE
jgi:hypothetical protein